MTLSLGPLVIPWANLILVAALTTFVMVNRWWPAPREQGPAFREAVGALAYAALLGFLLGGRLGVFMSDPARFVAAPLSLLQAPGPLWALGMAVVAGLGALGLAHIGLQRRRTPEGPTMGRVWGRFAVVLVVALGVWGAGTLVLDRVEDAFEDRVIPESLSLPGLDGSPVELRVPGRLVILNIWATWCPPCRAEMPELQAFWEAVDRDRVLLVGVNARDTERSTEAVADFAASLGLDFPLVLDEDGRIQRLFGATSLPTTVVIDGSGRLREIKAGMVGPLDLARWEAWADEKE